METGEKSEAPAKKRVPHPIPVWEVEAVRLLRAEMARKGVNFKRLERALAKLGIVESSAQLNRKINRGKFSASFLLACLAAIGTTEVSVPLRPASED